MRIFFLLFPLVLGGMVCIAAAGTTDKIFIGSKSCSECHPDEFANFSSHSKKAKSWESIAIMKSDLTQEELTGCYDCHTTGHGKPGGFVSLEQTPHLADVGCETCHGPGSLHAQSGGDPELIQRNVTSQDCQRCHNADRVANFRFKPLIVSGAH